MKILTPEEDRAHTRETYRGGALGALTGLALSSAAVLAASRRFPSFRHLSMPFRVFLVTSATTFTGVVTADHYSRSFEKARHADADFRTESQVQVSAAAQGKGTGERLKTWVSEQRYPLVFGSWALSMAGAFAIVSRSPHMTGQQKLVQARVYAQGLTLAVLVGSFMLEGNDLRAGKGRWETVKVVDPEDPEHKRLVEKRIHHEAYEGQDQWMDMIESQEQKMRRKGERVRDERRKQGGNGDGGGGGGAK